MQELKEKILAEGQGIGTQIIKVDGFLNHQIDVELLAQIGREFKRRFGELSVDKILTVEASGIAIACMTATYFGYPRVVFAKKAAPNTMCNEFYGAEAKSFTKGTVSLIRVAKEYIKKGERVLILDDFLAHGQAALAMVEIVQQADAKVVGIGIAIGKVFQGGYKKLESLGYRPEVLALIKEIKDGKIYF